jgi:hypothetical protein
MQDSSHLTIILCSSVIKIVISQKQKFNRKNNNYYATSTWRHGNFAGVHVFQENNIKTFQDCT